MIPKPQELLVGAISSSTAWWLENTTMIGLASRLAEKTKYLNLY
jgi:hypothetical protein